MLTESVASFAALCGTLDDPRRLELRPQNPLEQYHSRSAAAADLVELCYEQTKLRLLNAFELGSATWLFQQEFMQAVEYRQDRSHPLHAIVALPPPRQPTATLDAVLRARRSTRRFSGEPIDAATTGTLLFAAAGETGRIPLPHAQVGVDGVPLRTTASAGGLHPTSIYLLALRTTDLEPGVYAYYSPGHALEALSQGALDAAKVLECFPIHPDIVDLSGAAALLVITSRFWRARAKYGARGFRYSLLEAGLASQNASLMAVALGLAHIIVGGFYDDAINDLIAADGADEAVTITIAIGGGDAEFWEASFRD